MPTNYLLDPGFELPDPATVWNADLVTFTGASGVRTGSKAARTEFVPPDGALTQFASFDVVDKVHAGLWLRYLSGDGTIRFRISGGTLLATVEARITPSGTVQYFRNTVLTKTARYDFNVFVPLLLGTECTPSAMNTVAWEFQQISGVASQWLVDDAYVGTEPMPVATRYPENGKRGVEFERSLVDPVTGQMEKERDLAVDERGRNRVRSSIDALGRDEYLRDHHPRVEWEPPEP